MNPYVVVDSVWEGRVGTRNWVLQFNFILQRFGKWQKCPYVVVELILGSGCLVIFTLTHVPAGVDPAPMFLEMFMIHLQSSKTFVLEKVHFGNCLRTYCPTSSGCFGVYTLIKCFWDTLPSLLCVLVFFSSCHTSLHVFIAMVLLCGLSFHRISTMVCP